MALAIYSVSRQKNFMENYSQELTETLNEAMNVRIELEAIMENAVQISQTFVDQFEEKVSRRTPEPVHESSIEIRAAELSFSPDDIIITSTPKSFTQALKIEEIKIEETKTEETAAQEVKAQEVKAEVFSSPAINDIRPKKTRIYVLAKELQMSNQALIDIIRNLGIEVHNHMNALDERQVALVMNTVSNGYLGKPERETSEVSSSTSKIEVHPVTWSSFPAADNAGAPDKEATIPAETIPAPMQAAQPVLGLGFTIEELRNAHPYIAVKTLYDNGYPIRDIAKMLDRGQGEVSLILNLSKKKASVI